MRKAAGLHEFCGRFSSYVAHCLSKLPFTFSRRPPKSKKWKI